MSTGVEGYGHGHQPSVLASQAARVRGSGFAERATDVGLSPAEIEAIAADWERWGADPSAFFVMPHGEIICSV